eukprot:gene1181-10695_t
MSKSSGLIDFSAGCVGGVAQCLVGHPLDLVKVRLQTSTQYSGMVDVFSKVIKQEGMSALYKGVQSPLAGLTLLNSVMFFSFGKVKNFVKKEGETDDDLSVMQTAIAGGITGVIIATIDGPVDFYKCQLQVRYKEYNGFFDCMKKIYQKYGIRGSFQGFNATILRNVPANFAYFGVYEFIKRSMTEKGEKPSITTLILGGGFGGLAYWGLSYPLDIIKSTIQADSPSNRVYKSVIESAKLIYKEFGMKGFFRGVTPCLVRSFPANAACFTFYELTKTALEKL